jgi:hypothetical protein
MAGRLFDVLERMEFANGWTIDVHRIADGETWYQQWPPGVTKQGVFDNLRRTPTDEFNARVAAEPRAPQ